MSKKEKTQSDEAGAALIEYVMLLGLITAMILVFYQLLYPGGARNLESLVNAWGDKLATQIAGDKISADTEDAWATD